MHVAGKWTFHFMRAVINGIISKYIPKLKFSRKVYEDVASLVDQKLSHSTIRIFVCYILIYYGSTLVGYLFHFLGCIINRITGVMCNLCNSIFCFISKYCIQEV